MNSHLNIALFGAAHAGKSTLAGFLSFLDNPNKAQKTIDRAQKELQQNFDPAQSFAYIVDTAPDERLRTFTPKKGTSKRTHVARVNLPIGKKAAETPFTVIDTPGEMGKQKDRHYGMFSANLAAYCVEAPNIEKGGSQLLAPVSVWFHMKDDAPLIILVTKIDLVDDVSVLVDEFSKRCEQAFPNRRIYFCPISIDVKGKSSINVEKQAFNGLYSCLMDLLKEFEREIVQDGTAGFGGGQPIGRIFSSIRRITREGVGDVFLGKNLGEEISNGARLNIAPVFRSGAELYCENVSVRHIEVAGDNSVGSIPDGHVGGIAFSKESQRQKRGEHLVAFSENISMSAGRFAKVCVKSQDRLKLHEGLHVRALWLGKSYACRIVSLDLSRNEMVLNSLGHEDVFVVPNNLDPETRDDVFQIVVLDAVSEDLLAQGRIRKVGDIDSLTISSDADLVEILQGRALSVVENEAAGKKRFTGDESEMNLAIAMLLKAARRGQLVEDNNWKVSLRDRPLPSI